MQQLRHKDIQGLRPWPLALCEVLDGRVSALPPKALNTLGPDSDFVLALNAFRRAGSIPSTVLVRAMCADSEGAGDIFVGISYVLFVTRRRSVWLLHRPLLEFRL